MPIPAAIKIELVHRLRNAGLSEIDATSYVSPNWVPQMADNIVAMIGKNSSKLGSVNKHATGVVR